MERISPLPRPPDAAPRRWELLAQRRGPAGYLEVVTNTYRQPDGAIADWDILVGPDTVAVLALTPADEVVIARRYRPGPDQVLDELPGGMIEPGETPEAAAARELLEETGYAGTIVIAASTWLSAAATRRQWAALATGCTLTAEPDPDPGEFCEVGLLPLGEFRARLRTGQLTDTALAYLALDHLHRL